MTSLVGGKRVPKNSARLESYGTVDELNSYLGLIRSFPIDRQVILGIKETDIGLLEKAIDRMDAEVPPMKYFVLPGGEQVVSFCHIARTVCRRAERRILDLAEQAEVDGLVVKYINRLSDYLFILARKIAHDARVEEMKWVPEKQ